MEGKPPTRPTTGSWIGDLDVALEMDICPDPTTVRNALDEYHAAWDAENEMRCDALEWAARWKALAREMRHRWLEAERELEQTQCDVERLLIENEELLEDLRAERLPAVEE